MQGTRRKEGCGGDAGGMGWCAKRIDRAAQTHNNSEGNRSAVCKGASGVDTSAESTRPLLSATVWNMSSKHRLYGCMTLKLLEARQRHPQPALLFDGQIGTTRVVQQQAL